MVKDKTAAGTNIKKVSLAPIIVQGTLGITTAILEAAALECK
jgi:ABC-type dipeptide/oligopeptide/nickel transport system permease subunit